MSEAEKLKKQMYFKLSKMPPSKAGDKLIALAQHLSGRELPAELPMVIETSKPPYNFRCRRCGGWNWNRACLSEGEWLLPCADCGTQYAYFAESAAEAWEKYRNGHAPFMTWRQGWAELEDEDDALKPAGIRSSPWRCCAACSKPLGPDDRCYHPNPTISR